MIIITCHTADQQFDARFGQEVLTGMLAGIFACLAVLISCLGLFGLAAYMAQQRTREIGIRKVLGATVALVITLLTISFQAIRAARQNPVHSLRTE